MNSGQDSLENCKLSYMLKSPAQHLCCMDMQLRCLVSHRPDAKNAQYQQTIRHGDLLLNRLQRLAKVVDLE